MFVAVATLCCGGFEKKCIHVFRTRIWMVRTFMVLRELVVSCARIDVVGLPTRESSNVLEYRDSHQVL